MDAKLGTVWVAPGQGATAAELELAMRAARDLQLTCGFRQIWNWNLDLQDRFGADHKTNLALTGAPLSDYDLKRIAACE